MINRDQRLAASWPGLVRHDAATAGRNREERRIARGKKRYAAIDDKRHLRLELKRSAQEGVVRLIHMEHYGAPLAALVYRLLNPGRVQLLLISGRDRVAGCMQLRIQRRAQLREERFHNGTCILGSTAETETRNQTERREEEENGTAKHADGLRAMNAR